MHSRKIISRALQTTVISDLLAQVSGSCNQTLKVI